MTPLRQTRTRKPFPESLPRDEKRLLPAASCCPECGGALSYLGKYVAEQLELMLSAFRVRAAPTLPIRDPHKEEKMAVISSVLAACRQHSVFYEDEVDIHISTLTGSYLGNKNAWSRRGRIKKYCLAGALHSGAGKVSYVGGNSKSSALFISMLKHLKASNRRAKMLTLIVDNCIIHKSR